MLANPNAIRIERASSTSAPPHAARERDAGREPDEQVDDRLHDAEHERAPELADQQRLAPQRRQREPVQEAGLDVAGEVDAGGDRRRTARPA